MTRRDRRRLLRASEVAHRHGFKHGFLEDRSGEDGALERAELPAIATAELAAGESINPSAD
jgi:hypothetical protein